MIQIIDHNGSVKFVFHFASDWHIFVFEFSFEFDIGHLFLFDYSIHGDKPKAEGIVYVYETGKRTPEPSIEPAIDATKSFIRQLGTLAVGFRSGKEV